MDKLRIAIAGNPNCGKTTLLNALTGSRQHVGNWPGVTVERIDGHYMEGDTRVEVTDLPGIYSFSAYSIDESIARKHILMDTPDVVVNIVDASNLERNLYLTTQLLEMRVPVLVALNMVDIAKKRRIHIETAHLARHLGCPVVPIVASKGTGLPELRAAIVEAARTKQVSAAHVAYDAELEKSLAALEDKVRPVAAQRGVNARWLSIKTFEQDELALGMVKDAGVERMVADETARVEKHTGEDLDIVISDGRYGFIHGLVRDVVRRDSEVRRTVSDAIDRVVLNRVAGIPIFLAVMYLVFVATINLGGPFIDFFDGLCGTIFVDGFGHLLGAMKTPEWLIALLAGGIGGGIQTVATFIPPIFFIFLCLAFLEDSGYMARAAFAMDRLLRAVGLPGKAFIPMLVGFGCNVPAIMATRTLENNRDRILTIMMNPFMSCGARLPVYTLFVAAFFPRHGGTVLFGLYFTGIVLAVLTGLLFKRTILHGETSTFVMELPPYHMPTFRGILFHTWNRLKSFMLRAGRVIIVVVVALSFLNSIGTDGSFGNEDSENSALSAVSKKVGVVFRPMGLTEENWPGAVGLFTGLFAKEAVVGTLDTLYSAMAEQEAAAEAAAAGEEAEAEEAFDFWGGIAAAFAAIPAGFEGFGEGLADPLGVGIDDDLSDTKAVAEEMEIESGTVTAMAKYFDGKAGAIAYLLFILIYAPCVAAIAAIYRETNLNWAAFSVGYLTLLAWVAGTLFYQCATFSQHPGASAGWIAACLTSLAALYAGLRARARTLTVEA
ncbi:Fe(2+) transporter permease subunit FeoB [Kiritimatiella glycovorans]|uniref:Fe(2+) transporter permease subunit FeoB n=1 Tax=Kiritimatiella glycovorans TaxID=1307763 RepID=UPI00191BE435|nr:Fe(2+) transporter permease subunit FeoB [Kiritimatiella glycovorans]